MLNNNEITNGIHPHHACVTKKMLGLLGDNHSVGNGIFVVDDEELMSLNLSENERTILKPCYNTDSIGRYRFDSKNYKWIIYTDSTYIDKSKIEAFPNIKKHLDKYVDVITSDNRPYGLHRARKQEFFEGSKIVSLRKCSVPTFSYIEEPCYVQAEWYIIKTNRVDMKYLVGILNSKLVSFWLKYMGKMQGSNYQVDKEPLVNIPIVTSQEYERDIIDIVNQIMREKSLEKNTKELEAKLDNIIYKIYNINKEDINIIESLV